MTKKEYNDLIAETLIETCNIHSDESEKKMLEQIALTKDDDSQTMLAAILKVVTEQSIKISVSTVAELLRKLNIIHLDD